MDKDLKAKRIKQFIIILAILFALTVFFRAGGGGESIQETMKDAVLHDKNVVNFFGIKSNPGLVAAFVTTISLFMICLLLRVFVISKFTLVPGKVQVFLEELVMYFYNLAKKSSEKRYKFLSSYIFSAGIYIFISTLIELLGIQAVTDRGISISLPAPMSDINGAIMMGVLSFFVIVSGAISSHGPKGILSSLREISLPISMSFRLFGALLSGALVTELVYYYIYTSFVLPVIVGFLFTILHALIQSYVLTMLTAIFYGQLAN